MGLTLSYNPDIPQASDNPSASQGEILTNFSSIGADTNSWTTQDHYGFGTGSDGQHKNLNLPANNALGSQAGLASGVNTFPGTANTAAAQLGFKNSDNSFVLSAVRAFGTCSGVGTGPVSILNGYNVGTTASHDSPSGYLTVTMPSGTVTGTNYLILASCTPSPGGTNQISLTYQIDSATVFKIKAVSIPANANTDISTFSFVVLQI